MHITEQLQALETATQNLEPPAEARQKLTAMAQQYTEKFTETIASQKAFRQFGPEIRGLLDTAIDEAPADLTNIFKTIEDEIVPPGLNPGSGTHFGYIPGGGLYSSAVGDFIAAVTNRYAGVYFASPGAAALETRLINWMAELIGFPEGAGGFLASGGSIANLTAIIAAREHAGLKAADFSKAVIYYSSQTHHCVERGLIISGLKECVRRYIPLDEHFRMNPEALKNQIQKDREEGLLPWLLVASAGTTDVGAIDPLDELAVTAQQEQLWYHIDAAYGGFFMLTEEGKTQMKGIEKADSVVLDPHKGLFLPYGTGALIVRDVHTLAKAHHYHANYMQDAVVKDGLYSPADVSPELSKHFRGLRMWLPLKVHGVQVFRKSLEEKRLLALYAWEKFRQMEDIETGPRPQLTVFTFRWKPKAAGVTDYNELNRKIQELLLEDGRVFMSTTQIDGQFLFRFIVLSVRTHRREVDLFFKVFNEIKTRVSESVMQKD